MIEAMKAAIEAATELITGKSIEYGNHYVHQSVDKVSLSATARGAWIFAIHEVGHYLAANSEMLEKENLGMTFDDSGHTPEYLSRYLVCEVKALFITDLLFGDWLRSMPDQKCSEVQYAMYLCTQSSSILKTLEVNLQPIHREIWINQVTRKLSRRGLDLKQIKEFIKTKYDEQTKREAASHTPGRLQGQPGGLDDQAAGEGSMERRGLAW